ncbi:MAG: NAD(P)-dependent oxidoreductase [Rhodospirillales bacterium]|nr:NAD(P)-dependent oxidoreductase [Rhodospirillales bacterium]MDE2197518.1 NAD(P)-dependent oxidoreductase [Rhodospirillales bacterium]MDE2575719.1 NAD(P)-dependent oxidoreductase [Rhodospirillales bacterium]
MPGEKRPLLGFLGAGIMGSAMVLRLRERGWPVRVWNRDRSRLAPLATAGADISPACPRAVVAASDIVLICVRDAAAVEACVFGTDGLAGGKAALVIDHSTIPPAAARDIAARLHRHNGSAWIDAPVSGGPAAAREGRLTIMAGGGAADLARAAPVLADLAANLTHMGATGAGQTAKMINQVLVGTGFVLMAEALRLAEASGIDAARLPDCLAGGLADSALLQRIYRQMQQRAFEPPASRAEVLLKDLAAASDFARGLDLALPMLELAARRYGDHVAAGHGQQDSAAILRLYERNPS